VARAGVALEESVADTVSVHPFQPRQREQAPSPQTVYAKTDSIDATVPVPPFFNERLVVPMPERNGGRDNMKTLVFVIVLLVVGLGFYRGWFRFSTNSTDQQPSATVTVDKDKFHEDEQKAKDKVQSLGQETKEKVGDRAHKANE
jgi:hypothetical protein